LVNLWIREGDHGKEARGGRGKEREKKKGNFHFELPFHLVCFHKDIIATIGEGGG